QVVCPGRTSCLACSTHGGLGEMDLCKAMLTKQQRPTPPSSTDTPGQSVRGEGGGPWEPEGCNWGRGRGAVAGLMVSELLKLLLWGPSSPQEGVPELRNWWLCPSGGGNDGTGVGGSCGVPWPTPPDPPRPFFSRAFDPLSGGQLRAVPDGFTEWGLEEIKPGAGRSLAGVAPTPPSPSLATLVRVVAARFGVKVTSVYTASPGSECRVGRAGALQGQGLWHHQETGLLWAEWEREMETASSNDGGATG
ncbi:unnamed protein product, partial [Discosporangium mesarthrocarpum]